MMMMVTNNFLCYVLLLPVYMQGCGLSWAISEHLMNTIQCPVLFATHYHELTRLQGGVGGLANYHPTTQIDPDTGRLTMLYKLKEGPCDRSFGIHVAEFVGFPEEVVASAKAKAIEIEDFTDHNDDTNLAEPATKRRCTQGNVNDQDTIKGMAMARDALENFARIPLEDEDPSKV